MKIGFKFPIAVLALGIAALACNKEGVPPEKARVDTAPATAGASSKHAATGVEAGSHEDWCEEHRVAETLCTRCNPSLIAAFKATGDWCEEHGIPESQCRACNPDLKIERPPAKEGVQ